MSATEVKIKTMHAAGSAHGSLCEVEKVEHSVKEMVSGLRPGFKTPPLLSCLPDICNLGRLLSLCFLIRKMRMVIITGPSSKSSRVIY